VQIFFYTLCKFIYNLKLSRRLNSTKSSRAHSRVNWLQVETDVSGTISVPIIRVVMSCYVGFYLQPIDAAVCLRRFYYVNLMNTSKYIYDFARVLWLDLLQCFCICTKWTPRATFKCAKSQVVNIWRHTVVLLSTRFDWARRLSVLCCRNGTSHPWSS
jgi:hypothetical protein